MDKESYSIGVNIGTQLVAMGAGSINVDDLAQGIKDTIANAVKKGKSQREAGEKYLSENAKKEGVMTTPSGLQYKVLKEGTGKKPKATDSVKCHYEGMLVDGTVFDSSISRGEPAVFGLNQVIAGWTEGLQLMQEGAKYRFFIPYQLGYGERGAGASIPPFSALIFDVELISIEN
ncbi:MAG: FKBP-type peptidyl-prolyl cis-trans isomerase [Prevotella sp.]|nr:FKBP-type peptidyl-prolyl cis-trans isomerase [Prevotella sp.]